MALSSILSRMHPPAHGTAPEDPSVGDTPDQNGASAAAERGRQRSQSIQRLQIGLSAFGAVVLLIGLAQVIFDRALRSEAAAVPSAAATTAPPEETPVQSNPLAEAGVVPDLPADPEDQPIQEPAIMPEQGDATVP